MTLIGSKVVFGFRGYFDPILFPIEHKRALRKVRD
jgi:hypothetical protein